MKMQAYVNCSIYANEVNQKAVSVGFLGSTFIPFRLLNSGFRLSACNCQQGILTSSKSVAQLPNVDGASSSVLSSLRSQFPVESIHELSAAPYDVSDLPLTTNSNNLIIVRLPTTPSASAAYKESLKDIGKL